MARIRVLPRPRPHHQSDNAIPRKPFDWYKWMTIVLFTLPGFIILFTFIIGPAYKSIEYSQYKWKGLKPIEELDEDDYLGREQYEIIYEREDFRAAVNHTLRLIGLGLVIQLPMAMFLAVVIGRSKLVGGKFFRTIIFVPFVFSEPLTAIIWSRVLHIDGMLNTVLHTIIPGFHSVEWLADTDINLYMIFVVLTWRYFGLHMILYMAALQNVPRELEEAARIDGATEFDVLRKITFPLIAPTIRLTIYLSIIGSAQQFIIIQILTGGGPRMAKGVGSTDVIGTYLDTLRDRQRLGRASAVAVILFVAIFVFSILYQLVFMRRDFKNEKEAARGIRT